MPTTDTAVLLVAAIAAVLVSITLVGFVHTLVSIVALKLIVITILGCKGKRRSNVLACPKRTLIPQGIDAQATATAQAE